MNKCVSPSHFMFVILLRNFCYCCLLIYLPSVQFSSVAQSCSTLCDPMNCSTPGLPVQHQLPEFIQTHLHRVGDAIKPSHPLSSPSPARNPSQHQGLFQWVNFEWGGQSIGVSASASVLPMNTQDCAITERDSICFVHLMSILWFSGVGQQWKWVPYQQLQFKEAGCPQDFYSNLDSLSYPPLIQTNL